MPVKGSLISTQLIICVILIVSLVTCQDHSSSDSKIRDVIGKMKLELMTISEVVIVLEKQRDELEKAINDLLLNTTEGSIAAEVTSSENITSLSASTQASTFPETSTTEACPEDQGFFPVSGTPGCYNFVVAGMNYSAADLFCRSNLNSSLVMITSQQQQDALVAYAATIPGKNGYYIGAQRMIPNDCSTAFYWKPYPGVNIPLRYTAWLAGEPSCSTIPPYPYHESCVVFSWNHGGWDDIICEQLAFSICQLSI